MSKSEPAPAATILLLREDPKFEVLMVKRHHQIDFASGALVFPGGKLREDDADERWREHVLGWDEFDPLQRALRIGAIREVFEEAGVLLAEHHDAGAFDGACDPAVRAGVDRGEIAFADVVRDLNVRLTLPALTTFARWITPAMMPKRFDTWFFAAQAPLAQVAASDGRETVDAEWLQPARAVELAASRERTIIFPTLMNLRLLAQSASAEACIAAAQGRPLRPVLPQVEQREDGAYLVIGADCGYGEVATPLAELMSRGG
ncbi:MAG: NUDIX domain-containing protein [Hyphomonadaceae bacterium]